ncbi:terpenoid cyclases/Protein prenyltransferase [Cristinia sonorae]|uniref:Protein farnesyltransferase subunit beta n=1 Tax=Cristinia sonorae TaxID=1940300 RepID=A0A8K0UH32_9AGAR|nr:terpenoid cyclases/Protein prenyltransferase [Cristinia sonorae]
MAAVEREWKPTPTDGVSTPTSLLQASTEDILKAKYLSVNLNAAAASPSSSSPPFEPPLNKNAHLQYLLRNLRQGFPAHYISQSASQPWLIFWTLQGFCVLGVGLDGQTKKQTVETLLAMQHPNGGFGGGPGQAAHLLPTYAAVCALAIAGQPGAGGGWDQIDRAKIYDFFMSLKQPDGSFLVAHDAEVDVRGIYCLLAVATLLNILTPELVAGTPEFIASCQTYEGGFGNASFPGWALRGSVIDPGIARPPLGEAHGGYTFCGTASWVFLQPYLATVYSLPSQVKPVINVKSLLRWCVQMQGISIELGGFKGRTNKLVDGCYSWWVGGCVGLVEGLMGSGSGSKVDEHADETKADQDGEWDDVDDSLSNRRALQEYVLYAGQHPAGGLIDKPPKSADAYHTLYCLSGLSAAQHRVLPSAQRRATLEAAWKDDPSSEHNALRKEAFLSALSWVEDEGTAKFVGGPSNRVNATHPLFNLTVTHSEGIMGYFYKQTIPSRYAKKAA